MVKSLSRFALIVALLAAGLVASPRAEAAALPGGKANFVVSLGSFVNGSARQNWVRLGTYQFRTDGTVLGRTYLWWQRNPEARIYTGTTPDSSCSTVAGSSATMVRTCQAMTAGGYLASPEESRTGTYTYSGNVVSISWQIGQTWTEQWGVSLSPDGKLAKLDFQHNTLATAGFGYGSNAELTTRRAMSSVLAYPGTLRNDAAGWNRDVVTTGGGTFGHSSFRLCSTTTWCLTYHQPSSQSACQAAGGCPNYGGGTAHNDSSIEYYLVRINSGDRRDSLWHYCRCLPKEQGQFCYTGNSHVKPLLQIIDDDGAFHGWVGAEASFAIGTNRYGDYLSTFRLASFL